MARSSSNIALRKQFEGFCQTPFLWEDSLEGLQMISLSAYLFKEYPEIDSTKHLRLGKLIELFVLFELAQSESVNILASNIQVFRNRRTIGELDSLLTQDALPIHLEIIYKFYLYDPSIEGELNRWVGPNQNDSLVQKLTKLKTKQFPLLSATETQEALKTLDLNTLSYKQQSYFKAQLFVPYSLYNSSFPIINNSCIKGFYVSFEHLSLFAHNTFYIPTKLDWLIEPHLGVEWCEAHAFENIITEWLEAKKSPMCWMKTAEGNLQKFFVVWW